jgi:antitoxin component YwqK of YwqJK toxin-antitoxin module
MADPSKEVEVRDEQGRLTGRFEMAGGELHGLSTLYGGGRTIAEIGYANGLRHGEMRCYGEDGQLSSAVPHAGDVPHGEASFFHPGGGLARLAHYKDGRLHGEVRDFGLDGKEISSTTYIDGKQQNKPGASTHAAGGSDKGETRKSWLARLVEG